jgi:hypothetical protein
MFQAKIRTNKNTFTVVLNDKPYTVDRNHKNYDKLNTMFLSNNSEGFEELFNLTAHTDNKSFVESVRGDDEFTFDGNKIFMNGEELHGAIVVRINEMREEGEDFEYMLNFLKNLNKNTSARAKGEAYDFIANKNIPITQDGCILAYKSLNSDYYSKYAGTLKLVQGTTREDGRIYNGIGETIECDRSKVDDDRERECSFGLHAGGFSYAGPGGWYNSSSDKIVIVKVNPADIVAVPKDCNATKMRICKYTIVSEYIRPLKNTVENENKYDEEEEEEYEYEEDDYEHDYSDDDWEDDNDEDEDDEDDDPFVRKLTDLNEPVVVLYDRKVRSVVFKEEYEDHFIVELSEADPKYDADESNIRNFKKEKCQIV